MTLDAKRRASDALIDALNEGVTLRAIIELAMDDVDTTDEVQHALTCAHDDLMWGEQ